MTKLNKWLFLLSMFLVLFTLVREWPPFRIYFLDLAFIPCLTLVFMQKLVESHRTAMVWQRFDTLMIGLLVAVSMAFLFSEDNAHSVVGYFDWPRNTSR